MCQVTYLLQSLHDACTLALSHFCARARVASRDLCLSFFLSRTRTHTLTHSRTHPPVHSFAFSHTVTKKTGGVQHRAGAAYVACHPIEVVEQEMGVELKPDGRRRRMTMRVLANACGNEVEETDQNRC